MTTILEELRQSNEWKKDSACADTPIEWWFPTSNAPMVKSYNELRAICASCTVLQECTEDSWIPLRLSTDRDDSVKLPMGFRAGMSERERVRG